MTPEKSLGEIVTMLLAKEFARVYGANQAAAIKRCARKVRDRTKDEKVYSLCKTIAKAKDDARVIGALDGVWENMKGDGIL